MATLLDGTTFNYVRVWSGPGGSASNTIVGTLAGDSMNANSYRNTMFGYCVSNNGGLMYDNSVMGSLAFTAYMPPGGQANSCKNVAFGFKSMRMAPSVYNNVAMGFNTLASACGNQLQAGADGNIAIGNRVLERNNGGRCNIGIGYDAMRFLINGDHNIGIGYNASCGVSNNNFNIGIGFNALCRVTGGGRNIAIGALSGYYVSSGNDTISIGWRVTTSNRNGSTAIGAGGACSSTNCLGASSWTNISDRRDKADIELLDNNLGLNFIRNLRPVKFNFDFRDNYVNKCGFEYGVKDGTLKHSSESYGFIAQEIKDVVDNLETHFDAIGYDEDKDGYRLTYEELISPIVKSLQETIVRLEILESKV
jgi:hypothetical protein